MNTREKSFGEHRYPQRRKTPSFSSSLLEAIYRSIDESNDKEEVEYEKEIPSLRRAIMIEKWMEEDLRSNSTTTRTTSKHFKKSNGSISSDSSSSGCGTFFSSSDTDSGSRSTRKSLSLSSPPKHERKFMRTTKSRALKIYNDLKKVKQPISPGGRITSLLNSIFNSKSLKNSKLNETTEDLSSPVTKSRSLEDLTTSSSRTCLSKTPSSRSKLNNCSGLKRSVKFCPVSVIFDEDCQPYGHRNIYEDDRKILSFPVTKKNQFVEKKFVAGNSSRFRAFHKADDYGDDDVQSCSSSDLFELDNIDVEELPVYGTTNLKTKQTILANGNFIM